MSEPVVPAKAGTQSITRSGYRFKVMLMGLGPSRSLPSNALIGGWDDEYFYGVPKNRYQRSFCPGA